jgi:hypothetical protein
MEEHDLSYLMKREEFEKIVAPVLKRIEDVLSKLITEISN